MAYGSFRGAPEAIAPLVARVYPLSTRGITEARAAVITVPFDFRGGDELDGSFESKLQKDLNLEIESGRTYPQEDELTQAEFRSYFLSYSLVVGIFISFQEATTLDLSTDLSSIPQEGIALSNTQLLKINLGRCRLPNFSIGLQNFEDKVSVDWAAKCAFSYYIKPNYPGRSSHLCNSGFVVPTAERGLGLGRTAGKSFLFYAPRQGYRGSIFNLVYTTNEASVRTWESLGFQVIGTIPEAGRLKRAEGDGESYIDAYIVYGDLRKIGSKAL